VRQVVYLREVMSLVNNCRLYVRGLCLPHWYRWSLPECYAVQRHIIFVVNEHEVWWSMKNLKIHVFVFFKPKVASTLSCSCFYRNTTQSLLCSALTLAWAGGQRHLLCIWDVAGYDLNPETVCIDIRDFSQSFQCALCTLKGTRIVSFDILFN
jgi:hypothetical protein